MEAWKYPEIFIKKQTKNPKTHPKTTFFKKKRIRVSTFCYCLVMLGANKQFLPVITALDLYLFI